MKVSFEFEDENPIYELMDMTFVAYMKREVANTKWFLTNDGYKHPNDIKMWKKNVKALELLIRYYGGPSDSISDA